MDATELRTGNYLMNFLGEAFLVNHGTITLIESGVSEFPLPKGIPIDEYWLTKLGFYDSDNYPALMLDVSGSNLSCPIVYYEENCIHGINYDCEESFVIIDVYYVHQVQNIIYALTGEELKLNEH